MKVPTRKTNNFVVCHPDALAAYPRHVGSTNPKIECRLPLLGSNHDFLLTEWKVKNQDKSQVQKSLRKNVARHLGDTSFVLDSPHQINESSPKLRKSSSAKINESSPKLRRSSPAKLAIRSPGTRSAKNASSSKSLIASLFKSSKDLNRSTGSHGSTRVPDKTSSIDHDDDHLMETLDSPITPTMPNELLRSESYRSSTVFDDGREIELARSAREAFPRTTDSGRIRSGRLRTEYEFKPRARSERHPTEWENDDEFHSEGRIRSQRHRTERENGRVRSQRQRTEWENKYEYSRPQSERAHTRWEDEERVVSKRYLRSQMDGRSARFRSQLEGNRAKNIQHTVLRNPSQREIMGQKEGDTRKDIRKDSRQDGLSRSEAKESISMSRKSLPTRKTNNDKAEARIQSSDYRPETRIHSSRDSRAETKRPSRDSRPETMMLERAARWTGESIPLQYPAGPGQSVFKPKVTYASLSARRGKTEPGTGRDDVPRESKQPLPRTVSQPAMRTLRRSTEQVKPVKKYSSVVSKAEEPPRLSDQPHKRVTDWWEHLRRSTESIGDIGTAQILECLEIISTTQEKDEEKTKIVEKRLSEQEERQLRLEKEVRSSMHRNSIDLDMIATHLYKISEEQVAIRQSVMVQTDSRTSGSRSVPIRTQPAPSLSALERLSGKIAAVSNLQTEAKKQKVMNLEDAESPASSGIELFAHSPIPSTPREIQRGVSEMFDQVEVPQSRPVSPGSPASRASEHAGMGISQDPVAARRDSQNLDIVRRESLELDVSRRDSLPDPQMAQSPRSVTLSASGSGGANNNRLCYNSGFASMRQRWREMNSMGSIEIPHSSLRQSSSPKALAPEESMFDEQPGSKYKEAYDGREKGYSDNNSEDQYDQDDRGYAVDERDDFYDRIKEEEDRDRRDDRRSRDDQDYISDDRRDDDRYDRNRDDQDDYSRDDPDGRRDDRGYEDDRGYDSQDSRDDYYGDDQDSDSRHHLKDDYEYSEDDSAYNSQKSNNDEYYRDENRGDGDNQYYDQDDSDYDRRQEYYDQDDNDYDENADDRREGIDYDEKDDRFEDQEAIEREFYARHPEGFRESGEHASRAFPTESTMRSSVDSTDSYVVQRPLAFRLRGPAEKSGSFESRDDTMRSSVETRDDSGYVASVPQAFRVHGNRTTSPSEKSEDFDHRRLLDELGISD